MPVGLSLPNKKGKVQENNPLPVEIVEGDDILDIVQKGLLSAAVVVLVNNAGTTINPAKEDGNLADIKTAVQTGTESSLDHGSNLDIDIVAEQITSTSFAAKKGVILKADSANSGIIYIGNSDVTAGDTAATDGIPLSAGESIEIEIDNPNKLYAIGSAVNQKVYWLAI